ncbi:unnamed protein product [Brugia pahangi]|uniref:DUF3106 domain-containing protein n=1 Tax=Brugia pahangi TaxID=6280 RepID=A0A0N4TQA9_BRUPA|nr:unnamed protein product [Brugia pahangi]
MIHSINSIFLLVISTILLVASKPNISWNSSNNHERVPSFPSEPPFELKSILPPVTFAQLTSIHQNESLTVQQKIMKIDEIINALPENILQQLPLPPVFRLLPQEIQEMIKITRTAKNLTMQEKWLQMTIIIESLPQEQRIMLQQTMPHFPLALSSESKDILPNEVWNNLVAIYQDINLDKAEKLKKIDGIINALPDTIRQRLPLLSPFQKLPFNIQQQLRAVHMQQQLSVEQRLQKIKAIMKSLPLDMKKLILPQ